MEVPSEVLQKLVCERCSGYLSRGPVHLMEIGKYRCGRCLPSEEEDGTRISAYEELAKLMSFPCRYQENGCTTKVPFTDNERHEQACPNRKYLCPIAESGQCEWTGLQTGILEHCHQDHPTNVVENPYMFTCDITRPSLNNYILFVFEVLFLIQSKVCTDTRKIYHAVVRLIDEPARASDFKYTLDIRNNDRLISIPGDVLPRELMVLQENTSVVTGISLLEFLGNFKDTTFTVTIECSGQGTSSLDTLDHVTPPVKTLEVTVRCGKCWTVTEPVYRGDWMCKEHAPEQRMCQYSTQRCTYSDTNVKCGKHEWYYCQYNTWCTICSKIITGTTLDSHYTQAHGNIIQRPGTVCTVSPVTECRWLIIECDVGKAVCGYVLTNSYFVLLVRTPLPSAQLYKYRCTVELSHPTTGHTLTSTPPVQYDRETDWFVPMPKSDYNAYVHDNKIDIKINITKIDNPSQFMV